MPRTAEGEPFVPPGMPNYDDEELGFSFFRHVVEDADFSDLTLPCTFFGRSGLSSVSFRNTDLSGSRMCWNDFIGCDFSGADLSACDMRASLFEECKFSEAVLRGADLRLSTFNDCDFSGADLTGAVADEEETAEYLCDLLTDEQKGAITWREDGGEEPPGG
jgi:uncharacterized protein YjbI with pentapeptide repeats